MNAIRSAQALSKVLGYYRLDNPAGLSRRLDYRIELRWQQYYIAFNRDVLDSPYGGKLHHPWVQEKVISSQIEVNDDNRLETGLK
jgi:hypothetical protein